MRRLTAFLVALLLMTSLCAAAAPRVSLEIITRPSIPPTAPQQWLEALSSLGFTGLQIRSGSEGDKPEVESTGTAAAPAYRVVGILAADNMLHVPGGKFGMRETGRLRKWMQDLGNDGVEGVTQERMAFGLTPSQVEQVLADLRQPVGFSTLNMPATEAIQKISRRLRLPLQIDPGSSTALARVKVADELKDLTCGTALAAIVRPAGLVLQPRREGATTGYRITKPVKGQDMWPVGWPLKKRAADELPVLFEMLNVEIADIPVSEAIDAIQGRLGAPLVYDRTAMAMHGADPTTAPAAVPAKRMSYSQVLGKTLAQAKLRYEVRIDDADRPFSWITTMKRAPE
jgi:hypothetical protein